MKTFAIAVAAFLALPLIACGGGSDDDGPTEWETVAGDLQPHLDLASSNPCQNGDRRCLDIVLDEMKRRLEPLEKTCDHNAAFATMYLRMSEQIRDAYDAGDLEDPAATSHFTAWFASYYFRAFDDWKAGRKDSVPDAWQIAFTAADNRRVRGIGNLLLGMNAHVSRDLPYVVSDVLTAPAAEIDPDYILVNGLIERLSGGLLVEVAERLDPTVITARIPLILGGSETFGDFVTAWRGDSWERGNELLAASGDHLTATKNTIEETASSRALALLPEVTYIPFIESPDARDKYCREQK